ncbi:MAG: hypothetical protein VZS44_06030 [Bacilli bacterium]|nr:hypothetical protein [Bacilli bacterium]
MSDKENKTLETDKVVDDDKKKKETFILVPIVLSMIIGIVLIVYFIYICNEILYPILNDSLSGGFALIIAPILIFATFIGSKFFVLSIILFVGVWFFYIIWLLMCIFLFREGEYCRINSLLICMVILVVLLCALILLGRIKI